jgi:hypothetical protein
MADIFHFSEGDKKLVEEISRGLARDDGSIPHSVARLFTALDVKLHKMKQRIEYLEGLQMRLNKREVGMRAMNDALVNLNDNLLRLGEVVAQINRDVIDLKKPKKVGVQKGEKRGAYARKKAK